MRRYLVTGKNGAVVRADVSLDSLLRHEIAAGQCVDSDRTARTACAKAVERAHIVAPVAGWVSLKVLTFVAEIADDAGQSPRDAGPAPAAATAAAERAPPGDGAPESGRLSADALRRKEAGDEAFR